MLRVCIAASRIESPGMRERVHMSEQMAAKLIGHGKEDWVVKSDDTVEAKGKGALVTYWLKLTSQDNTTESVVDSSEIDDVEKKDHPYESPALDVEMLGMKENDAAQQNERLAYWNSEIMLELLQRIVSRRATLQEAVGVRQPEGQGSLHRSRIDGCRRGRGNH